MDMDDWDLKFFLWIFAGAFLLFLLFQIILVWWMKSDAKKNGKTYEYGKMKIVGFALLAAIILTVMFIILTKIGIIGIIIILGLPGALISFIKKGKL